MCPPRQRKVSQAPDPSSQAAADTLRIGDGPETRNQPRGRAQTVTAPVTNALRIPGTESGSGLRI